MFGIKYVSLVFLIIKISSYFLTDDGVAVTESNGHTQNGDTQNGVAVPKNDQIYLNKTNRDIVRLIGQHLKIVGLE